MPLVFEYQLGDAKNGLYAAEGTSSSGLRLYFLTTNPPAQPAPLGFEDAWRNNNGAYLIGSPLNVEVRDLPAIAQALRLQANSKNQRHLCWFVGSDAEGFSPITLVRSLLSGSGDQARVSSNVTVPFANVDLAVPAQTTLSPNFGNGAIQVQNNKTLTLERHGQAGGGVNLTEGALLIADPTDPRFGSLAFTAEQWDSRSFFTLFRDDFVAATPPWGGEVRYFYQDGDSQQLVYPVLAPFQFPPFSFDASLHPLLPYDATQTFFLFQKGSVPESLASPFGRSTTGDSISLVPQDGFGFYLGNRPELPHDNSGASTYAYLAPVGPFRIGDPSTPESIDVMCGLAGTEFLRLSNGDLFEFVPAQPAFADAYGVPAAIRRDLKRSEGTDPPLLSTTCTTSWVRRLSSPQSAAEQPGGYYSQPNASVNYGLSSVSTDISFPTPVSALLANLADLSTAEVDPPRSWPMAFYGGVFAPDPSEDSNWINQGMDGDAFYAFETQVLAQVRPKQALAGLTDAPVFQSKDGSAMEGRTSTRQGLLVALNSDSTFRGMRGASDPPAGTWQSLILAKKDAETLSIDADDTGVVDAVLASALSNNQVFAVLNNWSVFDRLHDTMTIETFTFQIRPGDDQPNPEDTLLVFKYDSTRSLLDLIQAPEAWAEADHLCTNVTDAQAVLNRMWDIAQKAEGAPHDPFVDFRQMAQTAAWTGTLCINAVVTGSSPDLQMLFDGIDGPLTAHHFGIELNQIQRTPTVDGQDPQPDIQRSSMFGVIYYEATPPAPNVEVDTFSVRELIVGITNSTVAQFNARVGMIIDELFGRDVTLVVPPSADAICGYPNMLCIDGKYQFVNGVGTITFALAPGEVPYFDCSGSSGAIRVVQRLNVKGATLFRVDDTPSRNALGEDVQTHKSRFSLNGEVLFNPHPFPGIDLDLYSYGNGGLGLGLQGLAFDITATHTNGKRVVTVEPNLAGVTVSGSLNAIRPGGLMRSLPLKLTAFLQDENGISPQAIGATSVSVPQLMAKDASGRPTVNYAATKPTFALRFDLPLGSLGSLSEAQVSLNAGLVLGWGPSDDTPDNDGATVYVQLPQLSAGALGFSLQGLIRTTFGDANLMSIPLKNGSSVYAMLFNNVALSIYGITLPPGVIIDFILFADPTNPVDSNLAWCLAAAQPQAPGVFFSRYRKGAADDPILNAKTVAELAKALDDVYGLDWPTSFPDQTEALAQIWALPIDVVKDIKGQYVATATKKFDFAGQNALAGTVVITIDADLATLTVHDIRFETHPATPIFS